MATHFQSVMLSRTVGAVIEAARIVWRLESHEAIQAAPGKEDTLRLDAAAEDTLIDWLEAPDTAIVTEERGLHPPGARLDEMEWVHVVDPLDNSRPALGILAAAPGNSAVGAVLASQKMPELEAPAISVCSVREGILCHAVLLNLARPRLYVASAEGCFTIDIRGAENGAPDLEESRVEIPWPEAGRGVRTYTGGREIYLEHAAACGFAATESVESGPHRVLYLTGLSASPSSAVLANGEKLGEWISWLAFAKWSRCAAACAVHRRGAPARGGMSLSPAASQSVLGEGRILWSRLRGVANPSNYRETVAVGLATADGSLPGRDAKRGATLRWLNLAKY